MIEIRWEKSSFWITALRSVATSIVVSTLVFGATARDWTSWNVDVHFVRWLVLSFGLESLIKSFNCVIPTYWYQTLRALLILPLCYVGIPTCLQNTDVLAFFRALHVGLLTSCGGYSTDLSLFKKEPTVTCLLVLAGMSIDMVCTFGILCMLDIPKVTALTIATIIPAPTAEVAEPIFRLISTTCNDIIAAPKDPEVGESSQAEKTKRANDLQQELIRVRTVFKCATLPLTFLTIFFYCSVGSDLNFSEVKHTPMLQLAVPSEIRILTNAGFGLAATLVYMAVMYVAGRICRSERLSSDALAMFVFATGAFSMYHIGAFFPVAAATAAIGGTFALRHAVRYDDRAAKTLMKVWPHTSALYYVCFAFGTVGYFCSVRYHVIQAVWKIMVTSLAVFIAKSTVLTVICRCCRISWLSSILLGLTLSSKGTVQAALSTMIPLKAPSLNAPGSFLEEAMFLQLYVLLNYMIVLPFIYAIVRFIVHLINKNRI